MSKGVDQLTQTNLNPIYNITKSQENNYKYYPYPIFQYKRIDNSAKFFDFKLSKSINDYRKMNYNFNPGLKRGSNYTRSPYRINQSPIEKVLFGDFNKMKYNTGRKYQDNIKTILSSNTTDKDGKIRDILREEMWNRSLFKRNKKIQMPYDEIYEIVESFNDKPLPSQPIITAKEIINSKLPLIKKCINNINTPFITDFLPESSSLNKKCEVIPSSHLITLSEPNHQHRYHNSSTVESSKISNDSIRDMKLRHAISSMNDQVLAEEIKHIIN